MITFGSTTAAVREAVARVAADGVAVRLIALRLLAPAQPERLAAALDGVARVLVVEQNHGAQLYRYLRSMYDLPGSAASFHRPGPLPLRPGELAEAILAWRNRMNEALACAPLTAQTYKSSYKPIWCPGCGDYSVLSSVTKALAMVAVPPEEVVVVSGIGCSSRIPAYTTCYGFHGVHGRALAAATGLKVARPDLTVLVAGGDGDGYSIGGNHFLHACRRNVDLTYIVMDNHVYGMTKGQPSPTTEPDWDSKLSPGGTGVRSFHPLVIALASGANFVARAFSGDPNGTAEIIAQAIRHPGFSFIEVLSPCVTFRPEQREWKKLAHPAPVTATDDPARAARRIMTDDGFNIGVLYAGERPPYPLGRQGARGRGRRSKRSSRCESRGPRQGEGAARRSSGGAAPRTLTEFMAQALVMEIEAAQRYVDFADAMETHNNLEVAALFRKMATIEGKHAEQIMREMGWRETPAPPGKRVVGRLRGARDHAGRRRALPDAALPRARAGARREKSRRALLRAPGEAATVETVRRAARELQAEEPSTSS